MKRVLLSALILLSALAAKAQVFIINDNMMTGRLSEIRATVIDSLTNEPVPFASFYVIPAKDTVISNFTLTDAEGKAKLEEVPYGNYVLHVEMLGYKPVVMEKYFRDRVVDMGSIKLKLDENYLKAAVVSDVGNPIVVKQDTVEFNASSFQVGTNAMLKDLLLRMPGMEITEEGKVKFNGEEIDKLTVGGRTFFFGDQSTALNNLPASIVDKVRVIDRESESTRDTGLQDGKREKVLDVGLKKEYEKGWFGNAGVKGGGTLASGGGDDPLRDERGVLYSGNVLASAYSEKDQVTVIGNGMNLNDSNGVVFVSVSSDGSRTTNLDQISSAAQLGVNINTSRIKDVESTVGSNYKYGDSQSGSKSFRTTFQDDGNIFSESENSGRQFSNQLGVNTEFKKEKGKVRFRFGPRFSFSRHDSYSSSSSETSRESQWVNRSQSDVHSLDISRYIYNYGTLTFRGLGSKDKRVLDLGLNFLYNNTDGSSDEAGLMSMLSGEERRDLHYKTSSTSSDISGSIRYAEPLTDKLTLSARAGLGLERSESVRDASDAAGRNDYYSSESKTHNPSQAYELTAQYNFTKSTWLTLGASLNGIMNETYSRSFNVSDTTGKGEWYWHLAPRLRFQHSKGNSRFSLDGSGAIQQPTTSSMRPSMNIANPSRLTLGNIYLRPIGNTNVSARWSINNREKFSTFSLSTYFYVTSSPITYARWYDSDAVMYSVPVNSKKSSFTGTVYSNYTTPLDGKKKWFLTVGASGSLSRGTSYQAKGVLPGLDKDNFDYSSFMETFWGDPSGNLFYSGKSGFMESNTSILSPRANLSVKYSSGNFSGRMFTTVSARMARYSVDPSLDMNTLDSEIGVSANYTTKHEFEFDTDLAYAWYNGYSSGYGDPEWQWNAEISKNIKAFNLSIKVHDILDQTRNLTHTVTANYEEDTYRLVMGRYILFGIKWNFGKMNAAHSQRAQSAAWNMAF